MCARAHAEWDLPATTHKLEVRMHGLTGLLKPVVTDLPRDWLQLPVFSLNIIRAEEVGLKGKIDLHSFSLLFTLKGLSSMNVTSKRYLFLKRNLSTYFYLELFSFSPSEQQRSCDCRQ